MTLPTLALSGTSLATSPADVIIVGALSSDTGPILHSCKSDEVETIASQLVGIGFRGIADEFVRLPPHHSAGPGIAVIGMGPHITADSLRNAAGSAIRQLVGVEKAALGIRVNSVDELRAVVEGAALGSYSYDVYRSDSRQKPPSDITVHTEIDGEGVIDHALIITRAVSLVKNLVNMPGSALFPESFAAIAESESSALPVSVTQWDETALRNEGFGGIVGVGCGSARPPRLVKVSYEPREAHKHLALVGKGITFDSGGLSLKPAASMIGMKYDMTGAATVLAVVLAAAELQLNIRLTAWLCLAENMPSGSATRPNDILTLKDGTTVEIINTDAEGRLVLADGLVAASAQHPDAIIDVATLTGAATVALGTRYVGVMGDHEFVDQVIKSGKKAGEHLWHMPLPDELRTVLDSDIADIANANMSNPVAGMLVAGTFLRQFVGTSKNGSGPIPWAHLDIAGTASNKSAWGYTNKGPTGTTVRSLVALAEDLSRS